MKNMDCTKNLKLHAWILLWEDLFHHHSILEIPTSVSLIGQ